MVKDPIYPDLPKETTPSKSIKQPEAKPKSMNLWFVLAGVIVVIVVVSLYVGAGITGGAIFGPDCHEEIQDYEEKYTESEPFTEEDCDNVRLGYNINWASAPYDCLNYECAQTKQVCIDKNWLGNCIEYKDECVREECTKKRINCAVKIANADTKGGVWSLNGYVIDENDNEIFVESKETYIQPADSRTLSWSYTASANDYYRCTYKNLQIPTKEECNTKIVYKDVTKTRTAYRTTEICK